MITAGQVIGVIINIVRRRFRSTQILSFSPSSRGSLSSSCSGSTPSMSMTMSIRTRFRRLVMMSMCMMTGTTQTFQ